MPFTDDRPGRSRRRLARIAAALAGAGIAVAMLVPGPAQATGGRTAEPNRFTTEAVVAMTAWASYTQRTTAPELAEVDLFRVFTDCLAEAAHGDSMYPGVDPAEVNACLEDHGVL